MPQKRKPEPPCDAKLQRVVRALDNVTRDGELFASGASEQFPCPVIAFKGDDEEELLFPLRRDDVQKIKARALVSQTTVDASAQDVQNVWDVDGAVLESHNWRWRQFLEERVTLMRATLGIAPTAVVNASLRKLMLVEAGGSLSTRSYSEERGTGVFGTLLVVLPGAFEGGDFVVQQSEGGDVDGDLFYDHCAIVAEPVTSGTALCLVYDLMTTTPGDIPLYAGPKRLQQFVDTALNDFFDVVPEPLIKQCKISDDAWRTANAFAVERPFVHIVYNDTFENLDDAEIKIMKSLASFCAQSGGQYALYLTEAVYSQYRKHHSSWSNGTTPDVDVTLKAPWNSIAMWDDINAADATVKAIVKKLHGKESDANAAWTNALVVLPTSIEARQMAKLPLEVAIEKLRGLLAESRDEALQYARRVVHYRPRWELCSDDMATFAEFVKVVVELNDPRLFNDVLLAVDLKCVDEHGALMSAVQHSGWEVCRVSIVQRILSTSTVCGRANFVISVFHRRMESEQIDGLLQALLSLEPWTDVKVHAPETSNPGMSWLKSGNFKSLVGIASLSAPQKMIAVASVRDEKVFLHSVAPAVVDLVERFPKVSSLRALLRHVWQLFQPMLPDLRNEWHAKIRLPIHCPKCDELQSFLVSSDTETIISSTSSEQRRHIASVICDAVTYESNADMSIKSAGESALRPIKKRRETIFCEGDFDAAEGLNKTMLALISPDGDQVNKDSPQHA